MNLTTKMKTPLIATAVIAAILLGTLITPMTTVQAKHTRRVQEIHMIREHLGIPMIVEKVVIPTTLLFKPIMDQILKQTLALAQNKTKIRPPFLLLT